MTDKTSDRYMHITTKYVEKCKDEAVRLTARWKRPVSKEEAAKHIFDLYFGKTV